MNKFPVLRDWNPTERNPGLMYDRTADSRYLTFRLVKASHRIPNCGPCNTGVSTSARVCFESKPSWPKWTDGRIHGPPTSFFSHLLLWEANVKLLYGFAPIVGLLPLFEYRIQRSQSLQQNPFFRNMNMREAMAKIEEITVAWDVTLCSLVDAIAEYGRQ